MSSNRRSDRGRLWRPTGWSLRTRLVLILVSLLAVVSVAIGVTTTVALRQFLVERVDAQLTAEPGPRDGRAFPRVFPGGGELTIPPP